jgi:hypothetical protein
MVSAYSEMEGINDLPGHEERRVRDHGDEYTGPVYHIGKYKGCFHYFYFE